MRLRVKDFGPIHQVDVNFEKLTMIIGKNNLGKSYLAQLHYTILDCSRQVIRGSLSGWQRDYEIEDLSFEFEEYDSVSYLSAMGFREQFDELVKKIKGGTLDDSGLIENLIDIVLNEISVGIRSAIKLSLERSFGVKVSKLVNIASNKAKIKWNLGENLEATVQISKKGKIEVSCTLDQSGVKLITDAIGSSKLLCQAKTARTRKLIILAKLYREVRRCIISRDLRKQWRSRSYYIPAGRGGLLESYETVVGGLVSVSPLAPVRGLSMPPLPGMASQFYSVLLKLKGHKGPLSKAVTDSFRQMLQGEIELRRLRNQPKYRMLYKFSLGEKTSATDIIHAASMIKELTPIYLIVQELVDKDDHLIIEEPESHLHPGAQIRFAKVISDLAISGVNVLITTHSDILLRAIGHLAGKKRSTEPMGSLSYKDVAIYWLKESEVGCTSETVKLSNKGIIEDIPTFDDIVRDLYETEKLLEKGGI